jgi:pimeloyl-ACP methyl ester carboxylesterase
MEELVLAAMPAGPVDAIGFSLGARTLLVLASAHPERFSRLVVAGVGANLFRHDGSSEALAAMMTGETPADDSPVARYFAGLAAQPDSDAEAMAACMRRPHPAPITDDGLAAVTCPVLVVIGDRDFASPGEPLVERLPDAELKVLRGVDHFATPKDFGFIDAALEFLGSPM